MRSRRLRRAPCLLARWPRSRSLRSRSPQSRAPQLRSARLPRAHRRLISHPQTCPSSGDAFYVCPRQRINSARLGTWVVVAALSPPVGIGAPPFHGITSPSTTVPSGSSAPTASISGKRSVMSSSPRDQRNVRAASRSRFRRAGTCAARHSRMPRQRCAAEHGVRVPCEATRQDIRFDEPTLERRRRVRSHAGSRPWFGTDRCHRRRTRLDRCRG